MGNLFRGIDLSDVVETGESSEPVQYVGCYVLKWGKGGHPTMGFVPIDEEAEIGRLRSALELLAYFPALSPLDPVSAIDEMKRIAREAIEPQEESE